MGSFVFLGLLLMTMSVYMANSQIPPRRQVIRPHSGVYGNGPRGGYTCTARSEERCASYCHHRGCDPIPCTVRNARFGCRCHNCIVYDWSHSHESHSDMMDWY